MDIQIGLYLLALFGIMIAMGVPIAIAIATSSVAIMLSVMPYKVVAITAGQKLATGIDSFSLLAVPFFVLAGNIMNQGGIAQRLVRFAYLFVGRVPGALCHVNVLSNMMFGSVSGSAVAAAAAVGKTLLPEVKEAKIDLPTATAINIASCPTGMLIPPSNGLIVYSVVSGGTSIGALFLGGYIPGILMGLACMLVGYIFFKLNPSLAGNTVKYNYTLKEMISITWQAIPSLSLIFVVIGSIIAGICTATEAACMAVLYSLILSIIYKSIDLNSLKNISKDTVLICGVVLFLIGASTVMSYIMAYAHLPQLISSILLGITSNEIAILLIINLLLLVVGMFMDMTPAILIFTPIFLPVATTLGIDPVHFGIIMTFNLCIGLVTPPVGTALFVGCSVSGCKIEEVIKPLLPLIFAEIIVLMLVTYVPTLSLAIPSYFGFIN
ncbi:TRAP transporter large permease [uncultured Succinatimonas sp.]|uniref:TRAP transporter large permease n=1 Tax=uncultured Succinatimonas sp. TaxID=1262973 RepID=UPI0025CBDC93|nr:TRAP transporter large permease [uncultured Succinatimonas sp.]